MSSGRGIRAHRQDSERIQRVRSKMDNCTGVSDVRSPCYRCDALVYQWKLPASADWEHRISDEPSARDNDGSQSGIGLSSLAEYTRTHMVRLAITARRLPGRSLSPRIIWPAGDSTPAAIGAAKWTSSIFTTEPVAIHAFFRSESPEST